MHSYELTRASAPSDRPAGKARHAYRIHEHMPFLALLATSMFVLNGCAAIEGIFKAGVWTGVLAILVAVALFSGIAMIVRK